MLVCSRGPIAAARVGFQSYCTNRGLPFNAGFSSSRELPSHSGLSSSCRLTSTYGQSFKYIEAHSAVDVTPRLVQVAAAISCSTQSGRLLYFASTWLKRQYLANISCQA